MYSFTLLNITLYSISLYFISFYIIFPIINQYVSLYTCLADLLIGDDSRILTNNPTTLPKCAIAIAITIAVAVAVAIAIAVGPFTIIHLYTKGTITFQHTPHPIDHIHIFQCKAYQQWLYS